MSLGLSAMCRASLNSVLFMSYLLLTGCLQWPKWQEMQSHATHPELVPDSMNPSIPGEFNPELPPAIPASPATVDDPTRSPRYLSLKEAFALALENGTIGVQSIRIPQLANLDLVSFSGRNVVGSDSIRVFALDPAIAGVEIESALSRFDAIWSSSFQAKGINQLQQGLSSFENGDTASLNHGLLKPLATGGVVGLLFSTEYEFLENPPQGAFSVLNPTYTTKLQLGFEQPLLRGAGVDINRVLSAFPRSQLYPALNSRDGNQTAEGILISRIRFDQQRAEFERVVNYMLLNVEVAYWNLYASYVKLYSTEQASRLARRAWEISKKRFKLATGKAQVARARGQYEAFRGDRLEALEEVLNNERTLRVLLGLPVEDGHQLIPTDAPVKVLYQADWQACVSDAMTFRPELHLARQDVHAKQLALQASTNFLLPDVRLFGNYDVMGFGSRLDGNGSFVDGTGRTRTTNALRSLTSHDFYDWNVGVQVNIPLGFRHAHSRVRQSKLQLAQSLAQLKTEELKSRNVLARQFGNVLKSFHVIDARQQQRLAYADEVKSRFKEVEFGKKTIEFLVRSLSRWQGAVIDEANAIADYNSALALLEFAKGTIQQYNNVTISEGPIPQSAQKHASKHFHNRARQGVNNQVGLNTPAQENVTDSLDLPTPFPNVVPTVPTLMNRLIKPNGNTTVPHSPYHSAQPRTKMQMESTQVKPDQKNKSNIILLPVRKVQPNQAELLPPRSALSPVSIRTTHPGRGITLGGPIEP